MVELPEDSSYFQALSCWAGIRMHVPTGNCTIMSVDTEGRIYAAVHLDLLELKKLYECVPEIIRAYNKAYRSADGSQV